MKRTLATIAFLTTATAATALLSACSSSPAAEQGEGPVRLTFWHGYTAADGDTFNKIITNFNASQDEVEIQPSVKTWAVIQNSLLPALSAEQGPQLVALPGEQLPVYAGKGAMAELDDYYASSPEAAKINPAAIDMEVVEGKKYGVPTGFVPLSVIYNKTMFAQAGITTFPTTWAQWVQAAQQLTLDNDGDGTPEQYGLALPDHETVANGVWASLFASGGGSLVDGDTATVNSPANQQTLAFWSQAVQNGKISPTGLDGIKSDDLFSAGKAAMEIAGPWMASVAQENGIDYALAPIPAGPSAQVASAIGISMGVTAQADEAEQAAAEKFFDYFLSPEVATQWSLGSGWPPLRTDVPASALAENPVAASLTAMAPLAQPLLPGVVNSADVLAAVDEATQKALAGADPAAALEAAQPKVQEALND
ncbi:multiple sugar transport system substrate-binding protein [Kineococcus radiotolerans]|uniref:Multiple sugar transport system substrate-binding protein n=1 Tax=Kineococcus radiotolerans TaxID=131568 RepID=A0A7W4TQB8_KINRA|nr:extracellular solute-binding protein [Kineococcus radiotolerans]MBB2903170.1 multiple sugar transport system substrate-binding protein [Kineococcus radiotolerans]